MAAELQLHLRLKSPCRSLCQCLLDFSFPWAGVTLSPFFSGTPLWLADPAQGRPELAGDRNSRNCLVSAARPSWSLGGSGEAGAGQLRSPGSPSLGFYGLLSLLVPRFPFIPRT